MAGIGEQLEFPALIKVEQFAKERQYKWHDCVHGFEPTAKFYEEQSLTELDDAVDDSFLSYLTPFAKANSFGAYYAFWCIEDAEWADQPIVVFNAEGDGYAIANNFYDFLSYLTYDVAPHVDEVGVDFVKNAGTYQKSPKLDEWLAFLHKEFGVTPITDPTPILSAAQQQHQDALDSFLDSELML